MKGVMERVDRLARITAAAHADFVQAVTLCVIADRQREGQSVFHHHRVATDVGFAADATKLVHA